MRLHDLSALGIGHAYNGALLHVGVSEKRGLHLRPGDVVPGRDDHVVGASGEVEVAGLVLHEGIASEVPTVAHIAALALVGEVSAASRSAHGEPAADAP